MRGSVLDLSRVVILGYGVAGRACHRYLADIGAKVLIVEDGLRAELGRSASKIGASGFGGLADLRGSFEGSWPTLLIISPGVMPDHPALEYFACPRVGEFEFGWRMSDIDVAAITGTNGKTTVTSLVTSMLEASAIPATPAGNFGLPLIELAGVAQTGAWAVAEASSFQLHYTSEFEPRVAAVLNVTPDHLDWHGNFDHYRESKLKLFSNLREVDTAIVPSVESQSGGYISTGPSRRLTFGIDTGDFCVIDGALTSPVGQIVKLSELQRRSDHDVLNLLAASAVAMSAGAGLPSLCEVARGFIGFEHRTEQFASFRGISFVDDSKSTTPASVVAALSGLRDCVLIAGGKNKGLDFSPICDVRGSIKAVVAIGDSAGEIADLFPDLLAAGELKVATDMGEAVQSAFVLARGTGTIILSPGATSYDWYQSYVERGNDFKVQVKRLIERLGD